MNRLLAALSLGLVTFCAQAINWEAVITNTNTPLSDSEIHTALGKGISANFANTFPGRQYGISVLLDTHSVPQLNGDLVYLALGLSHRLTNGALELPVGRFSDVVIIPPGSSVAARKELILQKLTALASSFSPIMMQNKTVFDQAKSSAPKVPGHWSEWPDYQPGAAGGGH